MVSEVLEIDEAELPERVPVEEAAHSERGEVSECVWWYQSGRGILSQAARLVRVVCLYTGEEVVLLGCSEKEDWKGTGTESSRTGSGAQAWLCHRRRVCLELPYLYRSTAIRVSLPQTSLGSLSHANHS